MNIMRANMLSLVKYEKVSLSNDLTDKEIRTIVKNKTQLPVRRLDTFTLISLLAVYNLFNQAGAHQESYLNLHNDENITVSSTTSLYSAAEYLSIDLFQSVLSQLDKHESIRPFDFIATVGNAANFYIAKEFNIKGPNLFIGASEQPFLKSCALAEIDLLEGHSEQAVIVVWYLTEHQRQCYAFLVQASENQTLDPTSSQTLEVSIDKLIKKGVDIPVPASIKGLF